jgi:ribosomal protein S14
MEQQFHRTTPTPTSTREHTRNLSESSRLPYDADLEVAELVERVCHIGGGAKAVASDLDLSYSQVRRMAGDGSIPSLRRVIDLVRLAGPDDPFRDRLVEFLNDLFTPTREELAERIVRRVTENGAGAKDLRSLVVEELTPGRWVRR